MKIPPLPVYSDRLVNLCRAYDRMSLADWTLLWHLHYLEDAEYKLDDWEKERFDLVDDILPAMLRTISEMIIEESKPFFAVKLDEFGNVHMPGCVHEFMGPSFEFSEHFKYKDLHIALYRAHELSREHHVILWEGAELFLVPKEVNLSFVEVWWRRLFGNSGRNDGMYDMCLIPNPNHGWDCLGHEK